MLYLKNEVGITKVAPVGFSWTMFFFGFFVPLFRGDFKWAAIIMLTVPLASIVTYGIGGVILSLIYCVKYNEWYLNDLKEKGFKVV